MTIEEKKIIIASVKQEKKNFDMLGIKKMNDFDMKIAKTMENFIPNVLPVLMPTGSLMNQKKAFDKSINYLEMFGPDITNKTKRIISNVKVYPMFDNILTYKTRINYRFDSEINQVVKGSGYVDNYKTPKVFDEVSPLWIAHENIHALKETNYDEFVDGQILGDVIPMFLELVMSNQVSNEKASTLLKNRLYFLKIESVTTKKMKKHLPKNLYDIYATGAMQYLNSFNYALQLYQIYRNDKEDVISKIKEVLVGQSTTRNILAEFAILNECDKDKIQYEMNKVISRIK